MTATAAAQCDGVNLVSDIFEDVINDVSPTYTVILTVYVNGVIAGEITIDEPFLNGQSNLILLPSHLNVTEFSQGVYKFELVKTFTNGTKVTEKACSFLGCGLECDIISFISSNVTSNIYHLFQLLGYTETCSDCNCDEAQAIYNYLTDQLGDFNGCECE